MFVWFCLSRGFDKIFDNVPSIGPSLMISAGNVSIWNVSRVSRWQNRIDSYTNGLSVDIHRTDGTIIGSIKLR